MSTVKPSTRGFTLVELLVVIAIIGILIALLLPAVQAAREAARRSQCTNQVKQIGLALHNYHDTFKAFPLGHVMAPDSSTSTQLRGSWIKGLLPFLELQTVYDTFDHDSAWWAPGNESVRGITINDFLCPSDIGVEIFNSAYNFGFRGNYVANTGIGTYIREYRPSQQTGLTVHGPFVHNRNVSFKSIIDGTSNTAAVTEIRKAEGNDSRGALFADSGTAQYCHDYVPNELVADLTERCVTRDYAPCTGAGSGGPHRLTARSNHPGGVNLLLFDGSVRFIGETIERDTWQALASMQGGEVVQLP